MIDIYIDDINIKSFGYDGDKNQLVIENGENKAMMIFDDEVLYQLYILVKNRSEMKGLVPTYNKLGPITVKIANDTDVAEVVRCKDCRHFKKDNGGSCSFGAGLAVTNENGYCSYGVKK